MSALSSAAGRSGSASPAAPEALSFQAIYHAHVGYLWNSLRRLGVAERDLEDVAHDALLAIHAKLGDYDASRPLRPWLFGFAYRVAADYRKRARRRLPVEDGDAQESVDSSPDAEAEAIAREQRAAVARTLASMPVERAAVLTMMDIDGCSAPEVASALGIPINTVYSRLRVARDEFATSVKRQPPLRGAR